MKYPLLVVLGLGAVVAVWWGWPPGGSPVGPGDLAATPTYLAVDGSTGDTARCTFVLTNTGGQPVVVVGVDTGCAACTALVADPKNRVVQPGESFDLSLLLRPPESGSDQRQFRVDHSGPGSPLYLSADVTGRRSPPYVASVTTYTVSFFDLASQGESQTYQLACFEPANAAAWVQGLRCNLPQVRIDPAGVDERVIGNLVRRVYHYRIGWHQLPAGAEFHGHIRLLTAAGEEPLAHIQGTRKKGP